MNSDVEKSRSRKGFKWYKNSIICQKNMPFMGVMGSSFKRILMVWIIGEDILLWHKSRSF